ncbi:acidic mammalian chitinase-like protein, partial [Tanacetum coccineum]
WRIFNWKLGVMASLREVLETLTKEIEKKMLKVDPRIQGVNSHMNVFVMYYMLPSIKADIDLGFEQGKRDWNIRIAKLSVSLTMCIKWFQELEGDLLFEQEKHTRMLESAEQKCCDMDVARHNSLRSVPVTGWVFEGLYFRCLSFHDDRFSNKNIPYGDIIDGMQASLSQCDRHQRVRRPQLGPWRLDLFHEEVILLSSFICDTIQLLPPCPWPEKVLGVKPHAYGSTIIVLLQDKEVESLQLLKDVSFALASKPKVLVSSSIGGLLQDQGVRAAYWPSFTGYPASFINTSYFSHIYYAFVLPSPTTYELDIMPNDVEKLHEFANSSSSWNLPSKTILSIGGGGGGALPGIFSQMASQEYTRASFINSTIKVARDYSFDGVDLDWELPSNESDMSNLGLLFKEWREALECEANITGRPRLILTSVVYYAPNISYDGGPRSYPIQEISQYVDWISPMCFGYHGSWENFTGSHSSLYDPNTDLSTDFGIGSWIKTGVPPKKIVMGLPLYGPTWSLQDPHVNTIGAPTIGTGPGNGILLYSQVVDFNRGNNATIMFDKTRISYYSYAGDSWISYDDIGSIESKVHYAQGRNLVVANVVQDATKSDSRTPAFMLRLHYHDCFVQVLPAVGTQSIANVVMQDAKNQIDSRTSQLHAYRLAYHECFVQGCDGWILKDNGDKSERMANGHKGVAGYNVIENAKVCVVSSEV